MGGVLAQKSSIQPAQEPRREGSPPTKVAENDHRHPPGPVPSTGGRRGPCRPRGGQSTLYWTAGRQGLAEQLLPSGALSGRILRAFAAENAELEEQAERSS